jgi:hypothetical protein
MQSKRKLKELVLAIVIGNSKGKNCFRIESEENKMVDYTKITVSKNGKYLFATEQGHLTYPLEAKVIYKLLKEKFPESEGYKVDVMMWESRGYEPDWVKEVNDNENNN